MSLLSILLIETEGDHSVGGSLLNFYSFQAAAQQTVISLKLREVLLPMDPQVPLLLLFRASYTLPVSRISPQWTSYKGMSVGCRDLLWLSSSFVEPLSVFSSLAVLLLKLFHRTPPFVPSSPPFLTLLILLRSCFEEEEDMKDGGAAFAENTIKNCNVCARLAIIRIWRMQSLQ